MRAERLDSMTGVSSVDLVSNQSRDFKVVARAVRCDAFCPAETPTLLSSSLQVVMARTPSQKPRQTAPQGLAETSC